jgi:hypothetical protein
MPLTTYEEARPWARAMKAEVVSGRMPRWMAARGVGRFANDRSLPPFEVAVIASWADGGAPEGERRAAGKPSGAPFRSDLTLTLTPRRRPPAGEVVTAVLASSATGDRWITGWRFHPNDPAIVQAEFSLPGRYLGNWIPPEEAVTLPDGQGVRLAPGAAVAVTVTYRAAAFQQDFPVGLPRLPPVLAFRLARAQPARERRVLEVSCGQTLLSESGGITAVRPIAGREGAPLGIAVAPPDGPPAPLLWLRRFEGDYRPTYRLAAPEAFTAGARLVVESDAPGCRVLVEY